MAIGIIGGSGLYEFSELADSRCHDIDTDWGSPSSPLVSGYLQGREVIFLARHGEQHQIPPHRVNYRANLAALKQQGARAVIAVNVVGGINGEMCPGDLVIPDQIVDYTWGREHTFFDGSAGAVEHVDFTEPYDQRLREALLQQAIATGVAVHAGGVYGATQGPRLESATEINRMASDGCDIVGMTGMPEAGLARELGLPYACLALVVNMAAGLGKSNITMADIQAIMELRMPAIRGVLANVCGAL